MHPGMSSDSHSSFGFQDSPYPSIQKPTAGESCFSVTYCPGQVFSSSTGAHSANRSWHSRTNQTVPRLARTMPTEADILVPIRQSLDWRAFCQQKLTFSYQSDSPSTGAHYANRIWHSRTNQTVPRLVRTMPTEADILVPIKQSLDWCALCQQKLTFSYQSDSPSTGAHSANRSWHSRTYQTMSPRCEVLTEKEVLPKLALGREFSNCPYYFHLI
jgi:hypothetical protein